MKKIVSILVAVLVVFSMFAITASAANAPTISAVANVNTAKVGDTVKVTVSTSANSKIGCAQLYLEYDKEYFQVTNKTASGAFSMEEWKEAEGKVGLLGITTTNIADDVTTLFTVEFKVLKTGGTIKFVAEELTVGDDDVTDQIASKDITIGCAHAEKTENVTKAPTCTEAGEKTVACKDCGASLGTAAVPATGHKFADAVVTKEATCTEKGEKTGTCTVCGEKTTEVIPMKDHKYGDWKVVTPATETKDGVKERTCEVCKAVDKGVISKKPAAGKPDDGSANIPNTSASMTFAFAAAGLALATGTVVRRKRK